MPITLYRGVARNILVFLVLLVAIGYAVTFHGGWRLLGTRTPPPPPQAMTSAKSVLESAYLNEFMGKEIDYTIMLKKCLQAHAPGGNTYRCRKHGNDIAIYLCAPSGRCRFQSLWKAPVVSHEKPRADK